MFGEVGVFTETGANVEAVVLCKHRAILKDYNFKIAGV
jgi:hypothetical protein